MDTRFTKKILTFFLTCLMVSPTKSRGADSASLEGVVKTAISQLGSGRDARVFVVLRDHGTVSGYVQETTGDGISLRVFCSGNDIPVAFGQIRGLHGLNVATGTTVAAGKAVNKNSIRLLANDNPCDDRAKLQQDRKICRIGDIIVPVAVMTFITIAIVLAAKSNN